MALRVTPIYRAGNRANLFLGADRRLVGVLVVLCFVLFLSFSVPCLLAIPLVWTQGLKLLRRGAAFDPQLCGVYWHYFWHASFYPARSTPHRLRRLPKARAWT